MSTIKTKIGILLSTISPTLKNVVADLWRVLIKSLKQIKDFFLHAARASWLKLNRLGSHIAAIPRTTKMFIVILSFLFIFTAWQLVAYRFEQATFVTVNILLSAILTGISCVAILSTQNFIDKSQKRYDDLQDLCNKRGQDISKLKSDLFEIRKRDNKQNATAKSSRRFLDNVKTCKANAEAGAPRYQYIIDALCKSYDITGAVIFGKVAEAQAPAQESAETEGEETTGARYEIAGSYALAKEPETTCVGEDDAIIGQTLRTHTPMILNRVPTDYLTSVSGLGRSNSLNVYIFPIDNAEGETVAVLETATFGKLSLWEAWEDIKEPLQEEI